MDLSLSEEQHALKDVVRSVLEIHAAPETVSDQLRTESGYSLSAKQALQEAGLTSLGLGDAEDATLVEVGVVLAELGYVAYPGPFHASVAAALTAQRLLGQSGQFLVELVEAGGIAAVSDVDLLELEGGTATGVANGVEWASGADLLVIAARVPKGVALWVARADAPGIEVVAQRAMDGTRCGAVRLGRAQLGSPLAVVSSAAWREHTHLLRLLRAADLVGVIRRVQEMTVAHVAQREQFGKRLGQFQAVQHQLANIAIDAEAMGNLVYHALWRYAVNLPYERHAAEAAWFAADAAVRATQTANQLHGGIGFMKEYHLHHFHNRSAVQRGRMGSEQDRITDLGDVVIEAASAAGFQSEFAEWPSL